MATDLRAPGSLGIAAFAAEGRNHGQPDLSSRPRFRVGWEKNLSACWRIDPRIHRLNQIGFWTWTPEQTKVMRSTRLSLVISAQCQNARFRCQCRPSSAAGRTFLLICSGHEPAQLEQTLCASPPRGGRSRPSRFDRVAAFKVVATFELATALSAIFWLRFLVSNSTPRGRPEAAALLLFRPWRWHCAWYVRMPGNARELTDLACRRPLG